MGPFDLRGVAHGTGVNCIAMDGATSSNAGTGPVFDARPAPRSVLMSSMAGYENNQYV
jgi:hypothetical protein